MNPMTEPLSTTKSGPAEAALVHPWTVRFTHWLNAVVLVVMTGSGLQIFAAFPSFGSKVPQTDLLDVPEALRLGGWLGGALQIHFTFAWIFIACGAGYAAYQALSGHWRQTLFTVQDLGGVWPMVRFYLGLGREPQRSQIYNPLQKLAYTTTVLCGAAVAITGILLFKPVQFDAPIGLAGGFQNVRVLHFLSMCGLLAFIPGHLVMVLLHGWDNFRSMWTGWKMQDAGAAKKGLRW